MAQIKVETLLKLEELFDKKKWNKSSANGTSMSLFNKFSDRLKLLSEEQQNLVIELTENYTWIELKNYLESFYDSLLQLGDHIYKTYDKIFVYPLLDPKKSYSKTKSGGFIHYMFEADDYTWLSEKFIPKSSLSYLYHNFNNVDSLLLLVDDFVGSGDTAISICIEYLNADIKNSGKIDPKNMRIVSIAAQQQGIDAIKASLNIDVISARILNKGISDNYQGKEKNDKTKLMQDIEKIINVTNDYEFGYKKSESLITLLNKSPNNTFPIYWLETRDRVAPFPRQKIFKYNGK